VKASAAARTGRALGPRTSWGRRAAAAAVLLAVLGAPAALLVRWPADEPVAPDPPTVDATDHAPAVHLTAEARARAVRVPPELTRRYPPRTMVRFSTPLDPRDFASGIACPGGGYLPLLNDVPYANGPLHRDIERYGPLPPVIGKRVDQDGSDWYVHADGSETTTRWTVLHVGGEARRDVRTDHVIPARDVGRPAGPERPR